MAYNLAIIYFVSETSSIWAFISWIKHILKSKYPSNSLFGIG